jgi:hypothetical protein
MYYSNGIVNYNIYGAERPTFFDRGTRKVSSSSPFRQSFLCTLIVVQYSCKYSKKYKSLEE